MKLDIISYTDLANPANSTPIQTLVSALQETGIVGISNIPEYVEKSRAYIQSARQFGALDEAIKSQYAPHRDSGDTEGYELGAEWFKDDNDEWQIDDKKSSFYAIIPDKAQNKWPKEVDLKTAYQDLGLLILQVGKKVLNALMLNEAIGIDHDKLTGYGRYLHYQKTAETNHLTPNWCGAHLDHCLITGLMPAYYFRDGVEVDEPEEAGLYILPTHGQQFERVRATDKSILLFQIGEFGQLCSNDRVRATKHVVKKAAGAIERFTLAVFMTADGNTQIRSESILTSDARYVEKMAKDGSITSRQWEDASFAQYRAAK